MRLDDFAIVQSNTLWYSLYQLITTVRGIVFLLMLTFVIMILGYILTNWVMGKRSTSKGV